MRLIVLIVLTRALIFLITR